MSLPPYVAVLRSEAGVQIPVELLRATGASAVLTWTDLTADDEPAVLLAEQTSGLAAVLIDLVGSEAGARVPTREVSAVLAALTTLTAASESEPAGGPTVIATTRPVTDTLKQVDEGGRVVGTAERDEHRYVCAPIAGPLALFRALGVELARSAAPGPGPAVPTLLAALRAAGAQIRVS